MQEAIKRGLLYPKERFLHIKSDYAVLFQRRKKYVLAFTLLELIIVVAIIGTLAAIGVPAYTRHIHKARVAKASSDIYQIALELHEYQVDRDTLPETLAEIGRDYLTDPWGRPYEYLKIEGAAVKSKGKGGGTVLGARKDRFEVPLNSDFDLYSKGRDGQSLPALTAEVSRDDVIRANNGIFIGLASDY